MSDFMPHLRCHNDDCPVMTTPDQLKLNPNIDADRVQLRMLYTPFKMQKCGSCKNVFYCSKACQTVDWKRGHKKDCPRIQQAHSDVLPKSSGTEKFQKTAILFPLIIIFQLIP